MPWGGDGAYQARRVRLVDCSAHGMGVIDSVPMKRGEQFAMCVKLREVTMVLYTVGHCRKLEGEAEAYKIGAKLDGFIGASDERDADRVLVSILQEKLV